MKNIFNLITLVCLSLFNKDTKVRLIYIEKKLEESSQIKRIIITGYTDSTMLYRVLGSEKESNVDTKMGWTSQPFSPNLVNGKPILTTELAGKWPNKGDSVLALINDKRRIELFAFLLDNNYRFWDPNSIPFANSIFIFPNKPPFYPIPVCWRSDSRKEDFISCADGCLVEIKAVKEK